jgi:hypothetical protein
MGYSAKAQPYGRGWKIIYSYIENNQTHYRGVRKHELPQLGFGLDMTLEEARARAKQLNAQDSVRKIEARRQKVMARVSEDALRRAAWLPQGLLEEFERSGKLFGDTPPKNPNKVFSLWHNAAKTVMDEIRKEPNVWAENQAAFFAAFIKHKYSLSTVQKVIVLLNRWGKFVCRKQGQFFDPLKPPKKKARQDVANANRSKGIHRQGNRQSAPLSFSLLKAKDDAFTKAERNWLYCTVAFGLRPEELDLRAGPEPLRINREGEIPVLEVYQGKLEASVDYEDRWKYIPCHYEEQLRALEILEKEEISRPSSARLKGVFGDTVTHYAGRNNFIQWMFEKGRSLEEASPWMGHRSIKTTWAYWQKLKKRLHQIKPKG